MTMRNSFYVRPIPQADTAILTPKSTTYGSLEFFKLDELQADLAAFTPVPCLKSVIVDLSAVARHGSGLLTRLIEFAARLREHGVRLIVCGDQTELVELVGGPAWCDIAADLAEALERAFADRSPRLAS